MSKQFTGTGVAVVTPFQSDGSIDFNGLERVLNHIIDGGVEFVLALGTTSEAPTLSTIEKEKVVDFFKEKVNGRVPIMLGIGGNNTSAVVDSIKTTSFEGIDSLLTVAPYYNRPGQDGLYRHFREIADACPVPVCLYNVPSRTSSNITAETCIRLAEDVENIFAVKEASGNMTQIMEIIQNKPSDFLVLSGDDAITLPLISIGMDGVISVVSNAYPKQFSDMVRLALNGSYSQAKNLHYNLLPMINAIFSDGSPGGIKAVLKQMGLCENELRLPLVPVNSEVQAHLDRLVAHLSIH